MGVRYPGNPHKNLANIYRHFNPDDFTVTHGRCLNVFIDGILMSDENKSDYVYMKVLKVYLKMLLLLQRNIILLFCFYE